MGDVAEMRFFLHYVTKPWEHLVVTGNDESLGQWNPLRGAQRLGRVTPPFNSHLWVWLVGKELLSRNPPLEFKFVLMTNVNSLVKWEWGPNRRFEDLMGPLSSLLSIVRPSDLRLDLKLFWDYTSLSELSFFSMTCFPHQKLSQLPLLHSDAKPLCAICLTHQVNRVITLCGHTFCQDCIRKFSQPVCPFCRIEFRPSHVMPLYLMIES